MNRLRRLLVSLLLWELLAIISSTVHAASYQMEQVPAEGLDSTFDLSLGDWGMLWWLWTYDEAIEQIDIGFDFPFSSETYRQVSVLTNGMLQFNPGNSNLYNIYINQPLPTNQGDRILAPYWDDLIASPSYPVLYSRLGSAPNRRLVVDWYFVRKYGTLQYMHFQVVLYENGQIRYRYDRADNDGASATIGLEVSDSDFLQYSYNLRRISHHTDLLFTPIDESLPDPVAAYLFESGQYVGSANELRDSSGNGLHGRAISPSGSIASTVAAPAIDGNPGTCRYSNLTGDQQYFEVADNSMLDLQTLTVGAWIRAETLGSGDLAPILSKDTNYEFHLDNRGRIYWWWQAYEAGSTTIQSLGDHHTPHLNEPVLVTRSISSPNPVSLNQWHHIAISYRSGAQKLYVDGQLVASGSYSGTLQVNDNPLQLGGDQWMAGRYFDGDIDEVQIFDRVLTDRQVVNLMNTTRPCDLGCDLGGFRIQQPDVGLACPFSRLTVHVQAMCEDDTTLKTDYAGTIQLSSSDSAHSHFFDQLSDGNEISQLVMDGTESGSANVYLYHQNDTPDLSIEMADQTAGIQSLGDRTTDVRSTGFTLDWPGALTCGASETLLVTAIGEDASGSACQRLGGFSGSMSLKAWADVSLTSGTVGDTPSSPLMLDGQAISDWSYPDSNNLTLNFVQGQASVPFSYDNSARFNSLQMEYQRTLTGGGTTTMTGASGSLLAVPEQLVWSVDSAASCASEDANCTPFVGAGEAFNQALEAQCSGGERATDFLGAVALDVALVSPAGGQSAALGQTTTQFTSSDQGLVRFSQTLSEVGVHRLGAESSWFGQLVQAPDLTVGRIYPHQVRVESAALTPACGSFTYMDQPGMELTLSVQAENAAGELVRNYDGAFAKGGFTWQAENLDSGTDLSGRIRGDHFMAWSHGQITDVVGLTVARAASGSPDGPFSDLALGIALDDPDMGYIGLMGRNMNPSTSGDCIDSDSCSAVNLATTDVRFGVLLAEDAYGPETLALTQTMASWYFDGAGFVENTDDQCTSIDLARLQALEWQGDLTPLLSQPLVGTAWSDGEGELIHTAPGIGLSGGVRYRYTPEDWLLIDRDGDGVFTDATDSEVRFGQYRGTDRIIFWREMIRE